MTYGTIKERMAEAKRGVYNTKKSDIVLQMTLDYAFVKEWPSAAECGRNGFSKEAVWACCTGKRKTHKGYRWVKAEVYYKEAVA